MDTQSTQQLSFAKLTELVGELRRSNERLRLDSAQAGRLSSEVQDFLQTTTDDPALALLALSQFISIEHSLPELVSILKERCAPIVGVDDLHLFILNEHDELTLAGESSVDQQTFEAAHEAYQDQAQITIDAEQDSRGCIALPLTRHGHALGVLTLHHGTALPSGYNWAMLQLFAGMVAVACDNIQRMQVLRDQTKSLEDLVILRTDQLQSSRDILRFVFDHIPDGVLLIDRDNFIDAINHTIAQQLVGLHPRQVVGWSYEQLRSFLSEQRQGIFTETSEEDADLDGSTGWVRCVDDTGRLRLFEIKRSRLDKESTNNVLEI